MIWFYYIINATLRILMFFCEVFLSTNTFLTSLIMLLAYSWNLLQCKMILTEILYMHLNSNIQDLSISNYIFIILRLSYAEIKFHTSTFITENSQGNYITYWDREMCYSQKIKLLLRWIKKDFLRDLNCLILLSTSK